MLLGIFILPDNFISASSTSFCAGRLSRVTLIHADYIISADKNSLCLKSVESLWNRIAMVKRLAVGSRLVYFRGGEKKSCPWVNWNVSRKGKLWAKLLLEKGFSTLPTAVWGNGKHWVWMGSIHWMEIGEWQERSEQCLWATCSGHNHFLYYLVIFGISEQLAILFLPVVFQILD